MGSASPKLTSRGLAKGLSSWYCCEYREAYYESASPRLTSRGPLQELYSWYCCEYYTVISRLRSEQSNYCPELVEKLWETVARGQRPRATVSQSFSITEGQWLDCSPSCLEITVLLPNCFKSRKHGQEYADARRWRRDIWRFVTSFVT